MTRPTKLYLRTTAMGLYLLDYGAGNVQSLANSLKKLGYDFQWVTSADDFHKATVRLPYVTSRPCR